MLFETINNNWELLQALTRIEHEEYSILLQQQVADKRTYILEVKNETMSGIFKTEFRKNEIPDIVISTLDIQLRHMINAITLAIQENYAINEELFATYENK